MLNFDNLDDEEDILSSSLKFSDFEDYESSDTDMKDAFEKRKKELKASLDLSFGTPSDKADLDELRMIDAALHDFIDDADSF